MDKLEILLISRCPPYPLHLGDRLIPYHLAEQLSARGHKIDLLAFYNQPDDPAQTSHYEHFFRSVHLISEPRRGLLGYLYRLLNSRQFFPKRAIASWSPDMWQAIQARLDTQHYDLVQLFGGIHVYEYRALVQGYNNLIVPYESFSLYLERLLEQQNSPFQRISVTLQLLLARAYERRMFDGYKRVVVLSEKDRDALNALHSHLSLHVIPNGVDIEFFRPTTPDQSGRAPILLFVGNYDYAPNLDAALWLAQDIFPRVLERVPSARLLLVGNNPPDKLRSCGEGSIEVTGRVPDVRPYLDRAMIFVSPLRFGAGIKNKVLEAMAMAKPLVITPLSADGIDLVEGTNALFGETSEQLAASVVRLLHDMELCAAMASANRHFVEANYTWRCIAEQYEALYSI